MFGGLYILMLSMLGSFFIDGVFGVFGMFLSVGDILLLIVGVLEKYNFIFDDARDMRPLLFEGLEARLRKSDR